MGGLTTEEEMALLSAAFQAAELIWKRVAAARDGTMSAADAIKSISGTLAEMPSQLAGDDGAADAKEAAKFKP